MRYTCYVNFVHRILSNTKKEKFHTSIEAGCHYSTSPALQQIDTGNIIFQ